MAASVNCWELKPKCVDAVSVKLRSKYTPELAFALTATPVTTPSSRTPTPPPPPPPSPQISRLRRADAMEYERIEKPSFPTQASTTPRPHSAAPLFLGLFLLSLFSWSVRRSNACHVCSLGRRVLAEAAARDAAGCGEAAQGRRRWGRRRRGAGGGVRRGAHGLRQIRRRQLRRAKLMILKLLDVCFKLK